MKQLIVVMVFFLSLFAGVSEFYKIEGRNRHGSISGEFKTPQDVTRKCLECHPDVGDQILKSRHWLWQDKQTIKRGGKYVSAGKINIINNFCIALTSNWPRCTSCHIGYGWRDKGFDFTNRSNIDCLVCHDTTGTYEKLPTGSGYPASEKTVIEGKTYIPPTI